MTRAAHAAAELLQAAILPAALAAAAYLIRTTRKDKNHPWT
jgi:hypothetical protein